MVVELFHVSAFHRRGVWECTFSFVYASAKYEELPMYFWARNIAHSYEYLYVYSLQHSRIDNPCTIRTFMRLHNEYFGMLLLLCFGLWFQ